MAEQLFRKQWVVSSILTSGSKVLITNINKLEMKRRIHRVDLLTRRQEKLQVKKSFFLSIGIIVMAILIFSFGIGVLGGFADFLSRIFKNDSEDISAKSVQPPLLDELPSATNSARLKISGLALDGKKVYFFLGEEKQSETEVSGDRFSYEDFHLKEGDNEVKAKSVNSADAESDFSKSYKIIYDQKEPELSLESPTDGQGFSGNNRVLFKGKTEKDAQVYANGFLANINTEGHFEVSVPMVEGDNEIEVKAFDAAGNTKSLKIKVHFSK